MNQLTSLHQPILFGHRGACAHAPENTLASFEMALQHGADAIELDAKMSVDNEVMVIHDQTVDRTTNGHGRVNELPLSTLRSLDAGSFFDPKFAGEKIPTLDEVFERMGRRIYINVELTNYESVNDQLIPKVAALVKKHDLQDWVIFSSFQPVNLLRIRRLLPGCPVGLLALESNAGALSRGLIGRWVSPAIIHPYLEDVTPEFVHAEKARGRRIHVWTVNPPEEMKRLFDLKVDGIFTDDPQLARKVLEAG
jgi:glycerophosphoryl diester phosphodiesterase